MSAPLEYYLLTICRTLGPAQCFQVVVYVYGEAGAMLKEENKMRKKRKKKKERIK